jgi:hypothetical protein
VYTRQEFKRLARCLIKAKDHPDEMRRYLDVRRQLFELRRRYGAAQQESRDQNPLAEIGFTSPLSIAGETSSFVIVRAEGMAVRNIPVAVDLDAKGKHLGTSMEEVREKLKESGAPRTDADILDLYERYVLAQPGNEQDRKIPEAIQALRAERKQLEELIVKLLDNPRYNTRRFMVIVEAENLGRVMDGIQPRPDHVNILSYAGLGSDLRVDGISVPVITGDKAGAQTVWMADLYGVVEMSRGWGGSVVCLDCHSLHWIVWISRVPAHEGGKRVGPLRYGYPGLKQEREADAEDEDEAAE